MSTVEYDSKLEASECPDMFQYITCSGLSGSILGSNPILFIAGEADVEFVIDAAYIRWQGDIGSAGDNTTFTLWRSESGEQHDSNSGGEQVGTFAVTDGAEDTNVAATFSSGQPILKQGDALYMASSNAGGSMSVACVVLRVRTRRIV